MKRNFKRVIAGTAMVAMTLGIAVCEKSAGKGTGDVVPVAEEVRMAGETIGKTTRNAVSTQELKPDATTECRTEYTAEHATECIAEHTTEYGAEYTAGNTTGAPDAGTAEPAVVAASGHEHELTPVYKTVVDREAYDEQVIVDYLWKYQYHVWAAMVRESDFAFLGYVDKWNAEENRGWTFEEERAFEEEHGLITGCLGSWHDDYEFVRDYTQPLYETRHYDAITHQEVDYYICSCGERVEK